MIETDLMGFLKGLPSASEDARDANTFLGRVAFSAIAILVVGFLGAVVFGSHL